MLDDLTHAREETLLATSILLGRLANVRILSSRRSLTFPKRDEGIRKRVVVNIRFVVLAEEFSYAISVETARFQRCCQRRRRFVRTRVRAEENTRRPINNLGHPVDANRDHRNAEALRLHHRYGKALRYTERKQSGDVILAIKTKDTTIVNVTD